MFYGTSSLSYKSSLHQARVPVAFPNRVARSVGTPAAAVHSFLVWGVA